jgi:dimethylglycine dehydrogenase
MGAQMGVSWGVETPLWFAPKGVEDVFSWRRSVDHGHVAGEALAVRGGVGIADISAFSKFTVEGPDAAAFLDRMLACRLPALGRMTLAPMLKHDGKLIGDLTLARVAEDAFFLAGSGQAEDYYLRWWLENLGEDEAAEITVHGLGLVGLAIAGPKARDVLAACVREDVSAGAFRFMDFRAMDVGMAGCLVGRVSFTGDLGYEIWMEPEAQRHVFETLMAAGKPHGIRPFGARALNALRLEKNYGGWAREYRPLYGPVEAGLDRFVAHDKPADFIGKAAARAERESGGALRLRAFVVDAAEADAIGDEPIWFEGAVQGWVTSGGFAHASGVSMAMGYVPKAIADEAEGWEIEILGERRKARLQPAPLFDPAGERMRG